MHYGFNSSMVQFKLMVSVFVPVVDCCFNSSMVQFKLGKPPLNSLQLVFQFLYGAIQTCTARYRHSSYAGFNSSMVQFKLAYGLFSVHRAKSFNSSMVQFKPVKVFVIK